MKNSKISILIPVYNRERYIADCIQSALVQTVSNFEIIIVDNASNDGTWEICQAFAKCDQRVNIYRNSTNIGPVRNWKKCIEKADGEYGKILWSDDLIAPNYLEKTLPFIHNKLNVGFVISGIEVFTDEQGRLNDTYKPDNTGYYNTYDFINDILFYRLKKYPFSPCCALFRLQDLREALHVNIPNKINSDFSLHGIGSDLLLFLIIAQKYTKFAIVQEKMTYFRLHPSCISASAGAEKLILHYDLAKAFFVENYICSNESIKKFNTILWLDLMKYDASKYGMNQIKDFYFRNQECSISLFLICKKFFFTLLAKLKIGYT